VYIIPTSFNAASVCLHFSHTVLLHQAAIGQQWTRDTRKCYNNGMKQRYELYGRYHSMTWRSLVERCMRTGRDTPSHFMKRQMEHHEGLFQIIWK
jgi:hypothetical protein